MHFSLSSVVSSSSSTPSYYAYYVDECAGSSTYLYQSTAVWDVGSQFFTNAELTTPFTGSVLHESAYYTIVNGVNMGTPTSMCYYAYVVTECCTSANLILYSHGSFDYALDVHLFTVPGTPDSYYTGNVEYDSNYYIIARGRPATYPDCSTNINNGTASTLYDVSGDGITLYSTVAATGNIIDMEAGIWTTAISYAYNLCDLPNKVSGIYAYDFVYGPIYNFSNGYVVGTTTFP